MKMRGHILFTVKVAIYGVILFALSSCFKDDTPVQLPLPGDAKSFQVSMGEDYHRQVYFDLNTTDTTGSEHTVWDLCFESTETGWHVWMNGGNDAQVANTDTQKFKAVLDTIGANWAIDNPNWNIDSTAVGDWRGDRMVYIIDRGPAKLSGDRFRKIIFQSVDASAYELQYSNLDGNDSVIYHVVKKPGHAFVYFSFDNGGETLDIEPMAVNWDVLFTRYRVVFYTVDPPLPYIVTGVLINPDMSVAVDSTMNFSEIDYAKALPLTYSSRRDIIGYNWKVVNIANGGTYTVKANINYIIRDMEGVYWKMHFIDFYNSTGEKGYPQFEFQRL